jgi:pimeloyl-ACP methyl ester carboxylesterase
MDRRGAAVFVHGGWGRPEDWQWVRRPLEAAGVETLAADLPSHQGPDAGLPEDAAVVRATVAGLAGPVVLVGWSYGVTVACEAADRNRVVHLVLVSGVPVDASRPVDFAAFDANPHIQQLDDDRVLLDNEWWVEEEAASTFPDEARQYARLNPRRPSPRKTFEQVNRGPTSTDWRRIPTTVLIGRDDFGFSLDAFADAERRFDDVRILDTDHFVIFRTPDAVAQVVLEALDRSLAH